MDNTASLENLSYNQAITEIENILREMQSENCDIDRLAENTRRAAKLLEVCRQKLLRTEREVQNIINSLEQPQ